jgi:selenocysteine-specific elongation factor
MLIGTAGHIDHGKTSLIARLTGRNTDRLPEEQRRGISIELGYAYLPLAGGGTLGFVDVPGHERFVHTMLAGATGIDFALLVVAADDGVMPQTEEHLEILRLLGVDHGAIALTKIDAVADERVGEVTAQIQRWLAGSAQERWPAFPLSSRTGAGVDALAAHLQALPAQARAGIQAQGFRLAVDRVFTLGGIGTVVTGTAHAGAVRVGDEVLIQPAARRARVRSVHAQDAPAESAQAGARVALNLAGLSKDEVARGDWVQAPWLANDSDRFDATLRLSARETKALGQWAPVHLHHGARDLMARVSVLDAETIAPGEERLVTVAAAAPLALCRGDRFVLRDASATRTLGGGRVLDIAPPARGKRAAPRLQMLAAVRAALSSEAEDAQAEAARASLSMSAVPLAAAASAWNLELERVGAMFHELDARIAGEIAFARPQWDELRARVVQAVAATHEREPEMPGIEGQRLRRMAAPGLAADAFVALIDELLGAEQLARRGAFLALPTHRAELSRDERVKWERIKPLLMAAPFGPPRVRDIARDSGIAEADVRATLRRVARVGEVTLVALDHFFLTEAVAQMADIVSDIAATDGTARAAVFRDRIGGGRKVAIQILEFFDRVGFTRRLQDDHLLRGANPWRSGAASSTRIAPSSGA